MFKSEKVIAAYSNLIGWKQHHDTSEIELPVELTNTDSGEYFQQKHAALRLDIIRALIPDNYDLEKYLRDKVTDASNEIFNDLLQYRQLMQYGATLLERTQLLNKYGWMNDKIVNENRFVGYQIRLNATTGLQAIINQIGVQFSSIETFNIYLFHSSKQDAIKEIGVTTTGNGQWDWETVSEELNGISDDYNGGVYLLGYYQEDITGNAINNTDFNWDKGACGGCNRSYFEKWRSIAQHFTVYPFYVPQGNYTKGQVPDLNNLIYINNQSYGLNLRLTVVCDLTEFFITNKMQFKNLLSLKVVNNILKDMQFSQEINYIEENIKMMIIRDLEGDKETNGKNIPQQYKDELKAVAYNTSCINSKCLPSTDEGTAPYFGTIN